MQHAVNGWGTAVIFERRATRYQSWLTGSSFVSFILPVVIGSAVFGLGLDWEALPTLLVTFSIALAVQGVLAACMIFGQVDTKLRTAQDVVSVNKYLATMCADLAKDVLLPEQSFALKNAALLGEIRNQELNDERYKPSEVERRRGGRAGLRRFSLSCGRCHTIPASDSAKRDGSKCKSCGDF